MNGLDRYEERVWDRFFDFVTQPVEEMTREEVQEELKNRGIDVSRAATGVHEAVAGAKARAALQRARYGRQTAAELLEKIATPAVSGMRDCLRDLIHTRLQGPVQAAYFRKLESAASDDDLRALLDDIERLKTLSEQQDA